MELLFKDSNFDIKKGCKFINEFINFRKSYLSRFSLAKIEEFIKRQLQEKKFPMPQDMESSIQKIEKNISEKSLDLSPLMTTFVHGSNAAILPNLFKTGMHLMASGRLSSAGVVLFSGEMREGASSTGINRFKISGTSLDDAKIAYSYAAGQAYQTNKVEEVNTLELFFNELSRRLKYHSSLFSSEYDAAETFEWARVSTAILRLRALDSELYKVFEEKLKNFIAQLESDFNSFKLTDAYKKNMPKKLDPEGTLGYLYQDDYWLKIFQRTEKTLNILRKALDEEIIIPKGIEEAIKNPYPLIFGSTTLHTYMASSSERCAQKASLLGKDIQIIYVSEKDKDHLSAFLKDNGIENKVTLADINELDYAYALNQLALPYFIDFISAKKTLNAER